MQTQQKQPEGKKNGETKAPPAVADQSAQQGGPQAAPPAQGTTAIAKRTMFDVLKEKIASKMNDISTALPEHLRKPAVVARWERVLVSTIARTPKLQQCAKSPEGIASLLQAIQQAAQLGLEPTGVLGSAYLVPFENRKKNIVEAQLIVGYRGLIDLARRSGQIESIEARVVHSNDRFKALLGSESKLEHEPAWEGEPGTFKCVYAVAKLKGGQEQIEVMTKAQVDAIRSRSKAAGSGPWVTDYEEMARKTVVRRIAKYLPLTPELADAFALDDTEIEDTDDTEPKKGGVAGLKDVVRAKNATVEAQVEEPVEEGPAHDTETGEMHDAGGEPEPGADEQAEIAAMEKAEAEEQHK